MKAYTTNYYNYKITVDSKARWYWAASEEAALCQAHKEGHLPEETYFECEKMDVPTRRFFRHTGPTPRR